MSLSLYRQFHDREPFGEWRIPVQWPTRWRMKGDALRVVYRSDKWGDGVVDYVHPFEPGAEVFVGSQDEPRIGGYKIGRPRGPVAWLGGVVELTAFVGGQAVNLSPPAGAGADPRDLPMLLAYAPGKTARLIFVPERAVPALGAGPGDVIIVKGGDLDVRPEGIVG